MLYPFLRLLLGKMLFFALHLDSGSFPRPLNPSQEQEAFEAFRAGDRAARERLIRHNLRLVAHIAKKYYTDPADQDDLVSIGTIGLVKAVDSFNPEKGSRFSTYASRCVENEIKMYFRHRRRQPTAVSLQEPIEGTGTDSQLTLVDALADEERLDDATERREEAEQLRRSVERLEPRQRQIITLRYGLNGRPPQTQQQVAQSLGISRSYVSRLEKRALTRLRAMNQNFY